MAARAKFNQSQMKQPTIRRCPVRNCRATTMVPNIYCTIFVLLGPGFWKPHVKVTLVFGGTNGPSDLCVFILTKSLATFAQGMEQPPPPGRILVERAEEILLFLQARTRCLNPLSFADLRFHYLARSFGGNFSFLLFERESKRKATGRRGGGPLQTDTPKYRLMGHMC